jgi:hypothetical protein
MKCYLQCYFAARELSLTSKMQFKIGRVNSSEKSQLHVSFPGFENVNFFVGVAADLIPALSAKFVVPMLSVETPMAAQSANACLVTRVIPTALA